VPDEKVWADDPLFSKGRQIGAEEIAVAWGDVRRFERSTQLSSYSEAGLPLETERDKVSAKGVLSNLPERNQFFTDRKNELTQLQEALAAHGRAALSGLGGVGKTQTAVEYAYRHSDEYVQTFWAIADSREAAVSGYVTIANLLKLPEADSQDQMLAVEAVKRWLGLSQGWLLILDNADDIGMARAFIPPGKNGHVLLTTRAQAVGTIARRVQIQEMATEEGALFLLRRAKLIAEDASLESAAEADRATAKEITMQLDGLPLALDQAGAYIEETGCGVTICLDLYRSHAAALLDKRGNSSIGEILKYSLLRRDSKARTLKIHRLVQAVLKEGMDDAARTLWAERAVRAVNRAFPDVEFSTWAGCEGLLPQAYACAELIKHWGFWLPEAANLLGRAGVYLYQRGRFADAKPTLLATVNLQQVFMPPLHPAIEVF
jgi:hypothetical protein